MLPFSFPLVSDRQTAKANVKAKTKKKACVCAKPTKAQRNALRRKTSFGVRFFRRKAIKTVKNARGERIAARSAGKDSFVSVRRFGSESEAKIHGRRFTRIERHKGFEVVALKLKPNAWVNLKTKKTNPLIGRKRTNRR